MSFSPQSKKYIDSLLSGELIKSEKISIGPLDELESAILEILSTNLDDISALSGKEQARNLLERYQLRQKELSNIPIKPEDTLVISQKDNSAKDLKVSSWRLVELCATSYRGLAPYGTEIKFPFEGKSNLIFGPNGSGKSSLLGAVVWVFTNDTVTDSEDQGEKAAIYATSQGTERGKKVREWPMSITLPNQNIKGMDPACKVTLELVSEIDNSSLWIQRSFGEEPKKSIDGEKWCPCENWATLGIKPLDLQLSLIAPRLFGRRTIENVKESKDILQLILGLDDLVTLGVLAGNVAKNRTVLKNYEQIDADQKKVNILEELKKLLNRLDDKSSFYDSLKALSTDEDVNEGKIKGVEKQINEEIEIAGESIVDAIGLKPDEHEDFAKLGDALTLAVKRLGEDFSCNFPSVEEIKLGTILPPASSENSVAQLDRLDRSLQTFIDRARNRIAERFGWWQEENKKNSRATLMLCVAQFYDPKLEECPVCDRSIKDLRVKSDLENFKRLSPELLKATEDFFRDLCDELHRLIPKKIRDIASVLPEERILKDWSLIKKELGQTFSSLTTKYGNRIQDVANSCKLEMAEPAQLLSVESEKVFSVLAKSLIAQVKDAVNSINMLRWGSTVLAEIENKLLGLVSGDALVKPDSLLTILSKGKKAASSIKDLNRAKESLRSIYKKQQNLTNIEVEIALLEKLKEPLENIKLLQAFAASEVNRIFGDIANETISNWKKLYPESSSGLLPGNLINNSLGVQALLSGNDFTVPAQYFANSGLQRAIALSFYFALLDQHPAGLGFVLLDDTILSLDEEHRESWSENILKPHMGARQFIVSTHQRSFLDNCRNDFFNGQVMELNPRDQKRRISWIPGNLLSQGEGLLSVHYMAVPNILRKYREGLLISLDAYSPTPFFDPNQLKHSLESYSKLTEPNPLAGKNQKAICKDLNNQSVLRVLDPGSHKSTDSNITTSMIKSCLDVLKKCDKKLTSELKRLNRERHPNRKVKQLSSGVLVPFPEIPAAAKWKESLKLILLGGAAAKPESMMIDLAQSITSINLKPGSAICVSSDTLDPVAKSGQWVILADENVMAKNGDLMAIASSDGRRFLRRTWSDEESWRMQSINPLQPRAIESVLKSDASIRKIIGVLYEPVQSLRSTQDSEWEPMDFEVITCQSFSCIAVAGDSLDPITRDGQTVLVAEGKTIAEATIPKGSLAVVETSCPDVGNVIKRVFSGKDSFTLVSPNPVDSHEPILMPADKIVRFWPLRGVLFEVEED